MTKIEIVDFLDKNYCCARTAMKSIKGMIEVAAQQGYQVIKNGVDDFELRENGVIVDFTKPLRFHREMPELASHKGYNGVPIALLGDRMWKGGINLELWTYLMNKKDNDVLHFDRILDTEIMCCEDYDSIVRQFDSLMFHGFVRETEHHIEVYIYPQCNDMKLPYSVMNHDLPRFASYKFNK